MSWIRGTIISSTQWRGATMRDGNRFFGNEFVGRARNKLFGNLVF
jgi:hypothetical protein